MDIEVRPVRDGEFEPFVRAVSHAFSWEPETKDYELERLVFEPDRAFVALDGERIVGGAMAATFEVTVPGGAAVPTAGVTSVGVVPTHRRRGVMTALMRRLLDDVRERGEPLAALYASEAPIYGRFGFGVATQMAVTSIERVHAALAVTADPRDLRLIDAGDAPTAFRPVYEHVRRERAGFLARNDAWWQYRIKQLEQDPPEPGLGKPFFVLCEGPEGPDGYAIYQTKHEMGAGVPDATLHVSELIATNRHALAALWRHCLGVDLMAHVRALLRPADEPLVHMLADPRRLKLRLRDGMWLRLVDVPGALAARSYGAEGRLVLSVRDGFCPWNEERFALDAGPDGADVRPSDLPADVVLGASDLGALMLGGQSALALLEAGRIEGDVEAVRRADSMFSWRPVPWCPQFF